MFLSTTNCYEWRQVNISECIRGTHTGRRTVETDDVEGIGFAADCIVNSFAAIISAIVPIIHNRHC